MSCIQTPGDLLFVPNNWGHAVLNLKSSVAIAWEGKQATISLSLSLGLVIPTRNNPVTQSLALAQTATPTLANPCHNYTRR